MQDGREMRRITDSSFTVIGETTKCYHLECVAYALRDILLHNCYNDLLYNSENDELTIGK